MFSPYESLLIINVQIVYVTGFCRRKYSDILIESNNDSMKRVNYIYIIASVHYTTLLKSSASYYLQCQSANAISGNLIIQSGWVLKPTGNGGKQATS